MEGKPMKLAAFSKTYKGRTVLWMPELELTVGKIYAVIGANGSGKSTLAKVLASVLPSDAGRPVIPENIQVGYMPQRSYAFRMCVRANLLLADRNPARAEQLMEILHIQALASQRADRLSGGETAKMALARVLMIRHDLAILDEPTAAMDMESTSLAEGLIQQYSRETHATILLVTHSLQQARRIADEALFLSGGELLESGPAQRILYAPQGQRMREFLHFYA